MKEYTSVRHLAEDLPALALPVRDRLRGKDGVFALLTDEGGRYFISLKDGLVTVAESAAEAPVCTVHAREADLLAMISGRLNPAKALLLRRVRLQGNAAALWSLISLL